MSSDDRPDVYSTDEVSRILAPIAEPLLQSSAFRRLGTITFLGALSPWVREHGPRTDGTRLDHSLHVANLALRISQQLQLSLETQRYAVAWGLLHDVATWALSHTSEPAFTRATGVKTRELREMFVLGSRRLPAELSLNKSLKDIGVDPKRLAELFKKRAIESVELNLLAQVLHSALTPDTLEGIWRSGRVFKMNVPSPYAIVSIFRRTLADVVFHTQDIHVIRDFWNAKARTYSDHINNRPSMDYETAWSVAIQRHFHHLKVAQSLHVTEDDIFHRVTQQELELDARVDRYKAPLRYVYLHAAAKGLNGEYSISVLNTILLKRRVSVSTTSDG